MGGCKIDAQDLFLVVSCNCYDDLTTFDNIANGCPSLMLLVL